MGCGYSKITIATKRARLKDNRINTNSGYYAVKDRRGQNGVSQNGGIRHKTVEEAVNENGIDGDNLDDLSAGKRKIAARAKPVPSGPLKPPLIFLNSEAAGSPGSRDETGFRRRLDSTTVGNRSDSQIDFFRMLDEKIANGRDYDSEDDDGSTKKTTLSPPREIRSSSGNRGGSPHPRFTVSGNHRQSPNPSNGHLPIHKSPSAGAEITASNSPSPEIGKEASSWPPTTAEAEHFIHRVEEIIESHSSRLSANVTPSLELDKIGDDKPMKTRLPASPRAVTRNEDASLAATTFVRDFQNKMATETTDKRTSSLVSCQSDVAVIRRCPENGEVCT